MSAEASSGAMTQCDNETTAERRWLLANKADGPEISVDDLAKGDQPDYPETDAALKVLILMASYGATSGVTLNVKGVVITGELISSVDYFRMMIESYEATRGPEDIRGSGTGKADTVDLVTKIWQDFLDGAIKFWSGEEVKNKMDEIRFIHLRNARFFSPGQPLEPKNGGLWRGMLNQVDAFSIGEIGQT